jgi:hypothetical protein
MPTRYTVKFDFFLEAIPCVIELKENDKFNCFSQLYLTETNLLLSFSKIRWWFLSANFCLQTYCLKIINI